MAKWSTLVAYKIRWLFRIFDSEIIFYSMILELEQGIYYLSLNIVSLFFCCE